MLILYYGNPCRARLSFQLREVKRPARHRGRMWEHPSPPAFEDRPSATTPVHPPTPAATCGRSRDPRGHLQLGQAPADSVCNGNSTLGAHQAVPKVDHLHLSQGLQGLQGGSAGQGEGQASSPKPSMANAAPRISRHTLSSSASSPGPSA